LPAALARHLASLGRRLGLGPDRAGLGRTGLALAVVLAACALAWPGRHERLARHLAEWTVPPALLLLWGIGTTQVAALSVRGTSCARVLVLLFPVLAGASVFVPAFHSSDLLAYVGIGRLQQGYGLDPYVHVPADAPGWRRDGALSSTWKDVPCTYGFLFAHVSRGVVALAGGDGPTALRIFKLLDALVLALLAWLVFGLVRDLGSGGRDLALFHLAWSPWVLLNFVANGHNDLWMALCLVFSVRLLHDGRWWGVVPALALGLLVKHLALLAVPFALVAVARRHGRARAALSALLGLLLVVLVAWPFLGDAGSFRWRQIGAILTAPWNSLQAAVIYTWTHTLGAPGDAFVAGVRLLAAVAFAVFGLGTWVRRVRAPDDSALTFARDTALVLFVLLCMASAAWFPWYPGMFLPLALLLPRASRLRRLALWVTAFQMLAFTPLAKARVLEALVMLALPLAWGWRATRPAPVPTGRAAQA
jgi:hypothetical protein